MCSYISVHSIPAPKCSKSRSDACSISSGSPLPSVSSINAYVCPQRVTGTNRYSISTHLINVTPCMHHIHPSASVLLSPAYLRSFVVRQIMSTDLCSTNQSCRRSQYTYIHTFIGINMISSLTVPHGIKWMNSPHIARP